MNSNDYASILANIARYVQLSEAEIAQLIATIQVKQVKKKQFIIQPGDVCRYRTYIVKGAFKVYHLDTAGKEHTVSIGVEDWFVTDFYLFFKHL